VNTFTTLELAVLKLLFVSSDGNGHDFGFIEDARPAVERKAQLAGVISSLVQKGVINVYDPVRGESGMFTQFDFCALKDAAFDSREEFDKAEAVLRTQIMEVVS